MSYAWGRWAKVGGGWASFQSWRGVSRDRVSCTGINSAVTCRVG